MTAPAWACPACGRALALDVWREAVALELPVLTCATVPGDGAGCGLLVCTWASGRRVWAAEAEELEALLAEDRMTRARAALAEADRQADAADALAEDDPAADLARARAAERVEVALAEFDAALYQRVKAQGRALAELERDARALRGR